jgi:hypothetical protein
MDGKLYAAHSNYPDWPMTSSMEIFDAETLQPVGSHSFGILYGSLTWVDWKDGHWWMTFANYDKPFGPGQDEVRQQAEHGHGEVQQGLHPGRIVDAAEGAARPLRGHEQLGRLVGAGRATSTSPATIPRSSIACGSRRRARCSSWSTSSR